MITIAPFQGLRYDPKRVKSLARVVTPPYDVISPRGQAQYYRRHPWNFVRVIFGREYRSDTVKRNRYSRARVTLNRWIRDGILKADPTLSVYPYRQEFTVEGRPCERWGIVALVQINASRIHPHEETRPLPKQDRLRLLRAVRASLSPILGLVPDSQGNYRRFLLQGAKDRRPIARVPLDGVRHTLWRVSDPAWFKKLEALLAPRDLVIADGHHRYEAAVAYSHPFAMFYLAAAAQEEPGLLATHRLLRGVRQDRLEGLLKGLLSRPDVVSSPLESLPEIRRRLKELRERGRIGLGFYTGNGAGYLLVPRGKVPFKMDVEWLHQDILPRWTVKEASVSYTQDVLAAARQLRQGKAQLLFLVQTPSLKDVFQRALDAVRMPGKTTYFTPKPLAGLVEYKF